MLDNFMQTLVTGSALLLSIIYLLGGLIINLHLAKFGIVDYQILQVKYLVVGLIYMPYIFGMAGIALIFGLALLALGIQTNQFLALASVLASIAIYWVWAKPPKKQKSFFTSWWFWILAGSLALVFPMQIFFQQVIAPQNNLYSSITAIEAALLAILALLAQVYHYAQFYYGRPHTSWNMRDTIGLGIPMYVEMAVDPANAKVLSQMGVHVNDTGKCGRMTFFDETDSHYILGLEQNGKTRVLKITKQMVKAILYPESK